MHVYEEEDTCMRYKVTRHSNDPHPLFYFMSFTNLYSTLTDVVIVHIFIF